MPSICIIKEEKTPVDRRVPLTPKQCTQLKRLFPGLDIVVQSSKVRCFSDEEYKNEGIKVTDNVMGEDLYLGVKEVPIKSLVPDKSYLFFSHTIKKQPYNKTLLQSILQKKITLIDYECLKYPDGRRIIGFGRFAGIAGTCYGVIGYGKKTGLFQMKAVDECNNLDEVYEELQKLQIPPIKIITTGGGNVSNGIIEVLNKLGFKKIAPEKYLANAKYDYPIYTQLLPLHYVRHKNNLQWDESDFFKNPQDYTSTFRPYLYSSDILITGHYWDQRAPVFFDLQDLSKSKISIIADISCDIDGPIPTTVRSTTLKDPFFDIDKEGMEIPAFTKKDTITVMAVDNLPCALPKDASQNFGEKLISDIIPLLISGDKQDIIKNATIAKDGKLTSSYLYLTDYIQG